MAASDLPGEFDIIVLGTGMPESIVAAAFSRIGMTVLHLDRNDHYSGDWASFNLKGLETWIEKQQHKNPSFEGIDRHSVNEKALLEDGEILLEMPQDRANFCQAECQYFVSEDYISTEVNQTLKDHTLNKTIMTEEAVTKSIMKEDRVTKASNVLDIQNMTNAEADYVANDFVVHINPQTTDAHQKVHCVETNSSLVLPDGPETLVQETLLQCYANDQDCQTLGNLNNGCGSEVVNQIVPANVMQAAIVEKTADVNIEIVEDISLNKTACVNMEKEQNSTVENTANVNMGNVHSTPKMWTLQNLRAEWRRFNLDLSPKVLFSRGDMVELLISSDIAKYSEFKTITRILTLLNGKIEKVPCSRADIFSSKKVNMLEKRMLMKFLQFCLNDENKMPEIEAFLDKPFKEFLSYKELTPTIKHYIQHSIAMATDSTTTQQGLKQMKTFLHSLGRYGNTAFLWPLYGSGELPQSFCRMSAVFGGIYCLRMSASSLILDPDNRCKGIITTEGQRIQCKWLIMESTYAPSQFITENTRTMSRAIILTDKALQTSDEENVASHLTDKETMSSNEQENLSFLYLPCPDDGDRPVFVLELHPASLSSPPGVYVFHLTRRDAGLIAREELSYAVNTLFTSESDGSKSKPRVLWSFYFTQYDTCEVKSNDQMPSNVILMSGPSIDIDVDRPVQEAKSVFKKVCPNEEFLPKAPNPEDIIYIDDTTAQVADSPSEFSQSETEQTRIQEIENNQQGNVQSNRTEARVDKENQPINVLLDRTEVRDDEEN